MEIQYDRAQKLTFLKLNRMSWDRVARAGSFVARWPCVFFTGGRRRVDNHMYLCSFPSPEMLHKKEVFESDTRTCSRPRSMRSEQREKYHREIPPPASTAHIMSVCICWDREEKNTHLKTFAPLLRATSVTSGDLLYL